MHTRRDFDQMTATLAWGKSRSRATTSHLSEIITNNRYFIKNKARVAFIFGKITPNVSLVSDHVVIDEEALLAATDGESSAHAAHASNEHIDNWCLRRFKRKFRILTSLYNNFSVIIHYFTHNSSMPTIIVKTSNLCIISCS